MKKILTAGLLILLAAACSQASPNSTPAPTKTPTITPTPTPNPAEILSRAGDAILALKSVRFSLVREGDPVMLDETTGMAFSEATGDFLAPDRMRAEMKVTLFGNVMTAEIYWLPEGVYLVNPLTNQIMPMSAGTGLDGPAMFQAGGMPAMLKTGVQNPQRMGTEEIEGVAAIHIAGQADGAVLAPLTAGALQSGTLYPVDVWVDVSTDVPVRMHVAEPDGSGWLIDLFDINAEIDIQLPQG
jgi:hypothetical protein